MQKKLLLIITDGIGYCESLSFNAFANAKKPFYDMLFKDHPYGFLKTYGSSVGLPDNQMGNSEVGHMTIGSGRILYQDLVKINRTINDNTLAKNSVLQKLLNKSGINIHLIGLISDGGVHSDLQHIIALAKICKQNNKKVFLHAITDGRDVSPKSATTYIQSLIQICDQDICIASICGRFYAMDRDQRWDRIHKAYSAIVESKPISHKHILDVISSNYQANNFDEFIEPVSFSINPGINNGDGVIFCNFRSDRMRELSNAICNNGFKYFPKKPFIDIHVATLTQYDENFLLPVLFTKENPKNCLAEILSKHNIHQTHIAETEKYAHVTFFFNGGIEKPFLNEKRVLIPSPKVSTYDLAPEMSAYEVANATLEAIGEKSEFIVVNFANGDMVGHTGVYEAAIAAVESVDNQLSRIIPKAQKEGYSIILTSDHGNCEQMRDVFGNPTTNHTIGDVFCFIIDPNVKFVKNGGLNNIAATVLKLMEIPIPPEMDESLF